MPADQVPTRTDSAENLPVEPPRFMGRNIPPLDRLPIPVIPLILIVSVIIWLPANPVGASTVLSELRTFVDGRFTWLFILDSVFALMVCIRLASSKVGKIRLGGPKAKAQHSKFA